MIYSVDFFEMTERINPLAVSKYLRDTGWAQFSRKRTDIQIYQQEKNEKFYQVTIPIEKTLSDYKQAMYKAISSIADLEGKSIEQVMLYLLNPNTDIIKIRLDKKDVESGNILFDDAIHLYENAKKLLAAATLDIIHPQKYHRGRNDAVVSEFLSKCRFGQTEIGSYVVSVVCPFAELDDSAEYKQLSIFSDEVQCAHSLTRKVTSRVINNIVEIKTQIDNGNMAGLLAKEGSEIISANFYEALKGLNLDAEETKIEFIAEWSPVVKNTTCLVNRITLSHDYYQPIEAIVSRLKEEKNGLKKIIGRIKKLESSPDARKRKMGKATIVYLDENNKGKMVTVELEKSDYDKAIEAHAHGSHVEIVGEMTFGKNTTMTCESFGIVD